MKDMKKIFLTIILLCAVIFPACSQNGGGADKGDTVTERRDDTETAETVTEKEMPDLPGSADFGGADFNVLLSSNWASSDRLITFPYIVSKELTGEVVNDAVYMRNVSVSEKYGVNITETDFTGQSSWGTGIGYQTLKKGVLAGDDYYDAAFVATYDVCNLAAEGFLNDLLGVPYINLDKKWWDSRTKRDLLIGDKMYFTNGDINILNNECTFCILFNKKLINDYNMDSPYELVKDSKWTLDKFAEMIKGVSADLNGDGRMDSSDKYGLLVWQDSAFGVNVGAGGKIATVTDGKIELSLYNERSVIVYEKYLDFLKDKTTVFNINTNTCDEISMFANDQALFHTRYIATVKLLRNMETDFGILPYPKFDEGQKSYYSNIHGYGDAFVCVPKTAGDLEKSGVILEALAAESMYNVTPAYYDVTLTGKFFRDEESRGVLDILFETRIYDVGLFYQVGGYTDSLLEMMKNLKNDFTSTYEASVSKALVQIDKINQTFSENN